MNLQTNNWKALRAFYDDLTPRILRAESCEWADYAYCWESVPGMINFTPIERWLWADIREVGAVMWPQYPVLNFFVDFANPVAKVAIECDGHAFHLDKAKDAERDRRLADIGWKVYRIPGSHCMLDEDEDTGARSYPALFMRQICHRHPVSRMDFEDNGMPIEFPVEALDWWNCVKRGRQEALARKRGDY